jgi:hypothetical protein
LLYNLSISRLKYGICPIIRGLTNIATQVIQNKLFVNSKFGKSKYLYKKFNITNITALKIENKKGL